VKPRVAAVLFPTVALCAAAFIWVTSLRMPPFVASHFDGSGSPNGFMPRNVYVYFMLGFVIGLPVLMVYLTWLRMGRPGMRINLPNREHWMAPVRRDETIAYLRESVMQFGILLLVFLTFSHWLVVRANLAHPTLLDQSWFIGGLACFLVAMIVWLKRLLSRFRKRD
jgi:hypothetical protein